MEQEQIFPKPGWAEHDAAEIWEQTQAVVRGAMAKAGNRNFVVKVYEGCNHSLLESDSGSPSTGGTEKNFPPGFWAMKTDWLLKHVDVSR